MSEVCWPFVVDQKNEWTNAAQRFVVWKTGCVSTTSDSLCETRRNVVTGGSADLSAIQHRVTVVYLERIGLHANVCAPLRAGDVCDVLSVHDSCTEGLDPGVAGSWPPENM